MTNEWIMIPNCNTLNNVSGEGVSESKVKSHKYANNLPLFSRLVLVCVSIRMVVVMEMMIFRCICDAFGILEPMVMMAIFTVGYVTHTARLSLLKLL